MAPIIGASFLSVCLRMPADELIAPRLVAWVQDGQRRVWRHAGGRHAVYVALWLAVAAAVALLVGTRWIPAALLGLLLVAGVGYGVWRWWRDRPSAYGVAQMLDHRLGAADQVATAYYYCDVSPMPAWAPEQRVRAWAIAERTETGALLPWEWPPVTRWLLAVLGICLVLAGVRLALFGGLALEQSLLPESESAAVAAPDEELEELEEATEDVRTLDGPVDEDEPAVEDVGDRLVSPDAEVYEAGEDAEMPEVEGLSADSELGDALSPGEESAESEGEASEDAGGGEEGSEGEETGDEGEWSEESDSLLDKLQDAFQNMLQTLDMDSPTLGEEGQDPGDQAGESTDSQDATDSGEQGEGESDKGNPGEGEPEGEGGEAAETGAEQAGEGQGSPTDEAGENADSTTSAAGAADGEKMFEDGEMLDLFEEYEELYQQRAEDIEGEVLVETKDADQQIRTNYRRVQAAEGDEGSLLHREEIPPEYREYIRRYYESLRAKSSN